MKEKYGSPYAQALDETLNKIGAFNPIIVGMMANEVSLASSSTSIDKDPKPPKTIEPKGGGLVNPPLQPTLPSDSCEGYRDQAWATCEMVCGGNGQCCKGISMDDNCNYLVYCKECDIEGPNSWR